ncbi:hypothetical protein JST99_00040 [Candidatus Dependentiae bacterium]|nr:hypothetical protein [Candidatus Dependentiae bacterium]
MTSKNALPILYTVALATSLRASEDSYTIPAQKTHDEIPLTANNRKSSFPYISGDAFREICDFIIDETLIPFNPHSVVDGDTIFVNADKLDYFFGTVHPTIEAHYILVTHNSDYDLPGLYAAYVDDPKIAAWFGQNVTLKHPKLFPIPIGLANKHWKHGDPEVVNKAIATLATKQSDKKLLYMNFGITHPNRAAIYALFLEQSFCSIRTVKNSIEHTGLTPYEHLAELADHLFVLSPRGNGLDTHRTWEALLMGAIPIVQTSASDSMYDELPVLIINDWSEVTEEFLHDAYNKLNGTSYNGEKLYAPYWIEQINACQITLRKKN